MKISVVINNYNYALYLEECILSAVEQPYGNKEIIVVDDGSTDASGQIIRSFERKIESIFHVNRGQLSALNAGLARATGDIIMLLDADDRFCPDKISLVLNDNVDFTATMAQPCLPSTAYHR